MKHIFASSSLTVTGNPENQPTQEELSLPDGKSIAELLLNETKDEEEAEKVQRKDGAQQSDGETLS